MRRIMVLVTVALMMAAMMLASAMPAFADHSVVNPSANCTGETATLSPDTVAHHARFLTPGPVGIDEYSSTNCGNR